MWSEAKAEFKDFFFFDVMGLFHITSSTLAMSLSHANEVVNSAVFFFYRLAYSHATDGCESTDNTKIREIEQENTVDWQ